MRKLCKERSLAFLNPKIAKEWDYKKNYPLTPKDVTSCSGKKVGWICSKGHKWIANISNRKNGSGCPYCSGRYVTTETSLAIKNPILVKEWNFIKNGELSPSDVTYRSNKKVWWRCKKGHEYISKINARYSGTSCPYCAGQKICKDNCLDTVNPELAREWNFVKNGRLLPSDVTSGSHKKVWWKCKKGHEWEATVVNRQKWGCPYCSGHKVCHDNCLSVINPKLAKEWHSTKNIFLTSCDVTTGSQKKVWWIGRCGHEWRSTVINRHNGHGCPYCQKVELKDETIWDSLTEAYYYLPILARRKPPNSFVGMNSSNKLSLLNINII